MGANASTRAIFALGRARLLPAALADVHPTYRTPVNAVHLQGILAIVLAIVLGLLFRDQALGGPLTTYIFIGYILGLLFAGMYIALNIAAIGYYLGEGRAEFNALKHVVVPIVGVILLIPAFLGVVGGVTIPILNVPIPPLTSPIDIVPLLVAIWMLAGIVLYFVLRSSRPDTIQRVGDVVSEA